MTDSESFPFESKTHKTLQQGAFSPSTTYSYEDIQIITDYAMARGIHVIPEIDMPAHSHSWSVAHPELIVQCSDDDSEDQLNISNESTYDLLHDLYGELKELFPARYIHMGANDIDTMCWKVAGVLDAAARNFWDERDISVSDEDAMTTYFFEQAFQMVFQKQKHAVVWQDLLPLTTVPSNVVVQVYDKDSSKYRETLELGYKTILSSNYFLSEMEHEGENWREFYSVNNAHMNAAKEYPELAIGGESCLWSDLIGPDNREPFLWPDAAVVAERLWTDESQLADADTRLQYWICRISRRGHESSAIEPGDCTIPNQGTKFHVTQSVSDEEIHFALTFTNPHAQQQTSDNILALNTLETSSSLGEVIEAAETVLGDTFFAIFSLLLGVVLGVSIKVLWNRTESKS
eukprot:CAMPEP_0206184160 /NCGR_PEP_ID=MMETSP0166-20121206/1060_1 /ASSEMBLY_ACC=CAM_ASM_000260 /TAXON_ID=95228 /ORGANISM="Vannella robusta, Strain DIVA3 518/3/11/1/6" /LENGTH=403 /DNA_ID=CAMNT_0053599137 /DNA_START=673 /DNA_END=1880 /DNA_ORIENTATION=+